MLRVFVCAVCVRVRACVSVCVHLRVYVHACVCARIRTYN